MGSVRKKEEDIILPLNIPTDYGEVRSSDQYVVATGSYCETSKHDIDEEPISEELKKEIKSDPLLGNYTVVNERQPSKISYEELPFFFKEQYEKVKNKKK